MIPCQFLAHILPLVVTASKSDEQSTFTPKDPLSSHSTSRIIEPLWNLVTPPNCQRYEGVAKNNSLELIQHPSSLASSTGGDQDLPRRLVTFNPNCIAPELNNYQPVGTSEGGLASLGLSDPLPIFTFLYALVLISELPYPPPGSGCQLQNIFERKNIQRRAWFNCRPCPENN